MFNLKKFKNNIALIQYDKIYFYKDIIKKLEILKKKIKNLENNSVLLITNNSAEFIFFYIYLINSKAKIILLDEQINQGYFDKILHKFNPNLVIKSKNFSKIKLKKKSKKEIFNFEIYQNNLSKLKGINKEIAMLLSTSGTSGSSKFVILSLKNLKHNTFDIIKYLRLSQKDRTITTLPFSYSYGLSVLNSHLCSGSSIILTNKTVVEKSFWDTLFSNKVNCFYGVPFLFKILEKFLDKKYFAKFKFLANAGGKLDIEVSKAFVKKSLKEKFTFYNMYGQTEASPRMSYINLSKFKKYESIGKPIGSGKFHIQLTDGKYIKKEKHIGELIYKGKNVMLGYANNNSDLKIKRKNKFKLYTGDLAYFDKNGYYYVVGRKSRFLKINGIRYDLDQIEKVLKKKRKNILCTGNDNLLKVFIVSKNQRNKFDLYKKEISRKIGLNIANISMHYIKFTPINKNGKVDYMLLNKSSN